VSRFAKFLIIGATTCVVGKLHATGYYGPDVYLDAGGKSVDGSPEFYWGLEIRRICREFHPSEKLVVSEKPKTNSDQENDETKDNTVPQATIAADLKDFDAALKEGRIKPPDEAKARQQQIDGRASAEGSSPLSAVFDSEFADYLRGAWAYNNKQWDEARKEWGNLLKRPEQDRHYRTVWAAFMLGKA